jgi:glycosyltransferase involved in cell wall biosynthesis
MAIKMKICIIIPAHNEERRISSTLDSYSKYFKSKIKQGINYNFLVVINASKDNTLNIVKSKKKIDNKIDFLDLKRGGKGYAVLEGFKNSVEKDYDFIGFVDADGATTPEAFYDLIKNIRNNDAIIASRYIKGAIVEPKPKLARIIVSRIFNAFIRSLLLLPYKDTQCGAKLFRSEVIKNVIPKLTFSKWAFDVDLIYNIRKLGYNIFEFPTKWSDKEYSKINFMKSGPWMALAIVRLRLINSPLRFIVSTYDKIMLKLWSLR